MDWLGWIEALPAAAALRGKATLYLLVNAAHIAGIGLLVGAILPLDLRLIGILRDGPLTILAPFLVRVAATGLAIALLTGALLFSVKPAEYAANPAFLIKMALLGAGLINILLQHRNSGWPGLKEGGRPNLAMRGFATLSFALWIATLVAGRWIGFL